MIKRYKKGFTLFLLSISAGLIACTDKKQENIALIEPEKPDASVVNHNKSKPNIVFIFADDQSPKTIGAYGNTEIKTPNIDLLAQQGVNFSNAHNMGAWNGAVCQASRTMLNTGRSVWNAHAFEKKLNVPSSINSTWGKLLENAGYDTYMTGKWHVHAPAEKVFQHTLNVRPGMPKDNWDHSTMVQMFNDFYAGKTQYKSPDEFMPVGYNRPISNKDESWSPTDDVHGGFYQGGKHWSEVLKDNALSFIAKAKEKETPFFMYLAFNAPHDPRQAPKAYQDLYNAETLSLPESFQPLYTDKDSMGNGPSLRDAALAPFPRTEYATKVHLKEYYALISHLDTQIGEIVSALKASGKMDNTYIIYTADHGLAVGEHGLFGKQNMYDHSIRAPFIIWGPDMQGGQTISENIYIQDAMATTLDLADAQKPDYVFFNSIKELAQGKSNKSPYSAIYGSYIKSQRMIKKDDYKLIVYPNINKVKLFDLKNDPEEMHDLSSENKYQAKVTLLFDELIGLQKSLNDELDLSNTYKLWVK